MLAVEARGYKIGYEAYKESEQAFKLAERELLRQIEKWIWRIAGENEISYAEAKKLLTAGELEEFKWDVTEYIEKGKKNAINAAWIHELENASARAHISRLEAMKLQLREYLEEAFNVENAATETALAKIYESEYYHTAYEVQKGIGVGYEIGGINEKAISQAVKKPWAADGKDFSSRIWDNKAKMVGTLEQEITRQIITGDSPDAAIEALTEYVKSDVTNAKQKAGTLIMTESAVIGNKAQHDCYKELGVEEFEVVETLDTHTCERCGEMDSKHFPMDQFEIGVTAPPFHPNCRGCTAPYFDDEFQPKKRAARDSVTGKTVQVDTMSYEEWKKAYVDTTPENIIRKAAENNKINGVNFSANPRKIDLTKYDFDEKHINQERKHNVTKEDAQHYIDSAITSCERFNGKFLCYFSSDGVVYIDKKQKLVRTAFERREYNDKMLSFIKEIEGR